MQVGFPRNIPDHRGLSLKVDVRHTNENDRFSRRSAFFRDNRERSFFASIGVFSPWGPTGGRLLTSQVAQWFTNTCLLDFAASSPAFDYWTFLHLKVRNCQYILIVRISSEFSARSILLIRMQTSQWKKSVDIGLFFFFIHILISYRLIKI